MRSTDPSGGGLDLETVYNAATPFSREDSANISSDVTQDLLDDSEEAPLIVN